ncbi:MAG: tryptophan--tRNA ligase [Planctomycetes bacterium]|nr:tryptophan--tRNA ligase [Planctomycetota bacterium]
MTESKGRQRIFSGIQPTGEPHLGNYLGAIRQWVQQQNAPAPHDALYSIVDYHALTIEMEPGSLDRFTLDLTASLLACGLDPERITLFRQSDVPEHTELGWIFSCVAAMGDLHRMTQFKDKADQNKDNVNVGLFAYPVLQSADILLYKANLVPVGDDQVQHLELARECARRFNRRFGETFPEPQPLLSTVPRLKGLDGSAKMSKSKGNTVSLSEAPEQIRAKLKVAVTDPARLRRNDPGHPEVCNVFTLHGCFTGPANPARVAAIEADCRSAALGCVDCKKELADRIVEQLGPIRDRQAAWRARPDDLRDLLEKGRRKAAEIARATMEEVRVRIGVRAPPNSR